MVYMPMPRTYSDDELRAAIAASFTWSDVGRRLGNITRARHARTIADELGIDYSHFTGQSWNRGRKYRAPIANKLTKDSGFIKNLRVMLIEDGHKKEQCEECGLTEWNGLPAPLEVDHVNGIVTDNRLENLRILCCNCHAQTPTWRRRKQARVVER